MACRRSVAGPRLGRSRRSETVSCLRVDWISLSFLTVGDVLLGNVEFQHRLAAQLNTHANSYAERWVRSVKEECLSRLMLFSRGSCPPKSSCCVEARIVLGLFYQEKFRFRSG